MRIFIVLTILLLFSTQAKAYNIFPDWAFGQTVAVHGGGGSNHSDFHVSYTANFLILGAGFDAGTSNGDSYYNNYVVLKTRLSLPIYDRYREAVFIYYEPGLMFQDGRKDSEDFNSTVWSNKFGLDYLNEDSWLFGMGARLAQDFETSVFLTLGHFF